MPQQVMYAWGHVIVIHCATINFIKYNDFVCKLVSLTCKQIAFLWRHTLFRSSVTIYFLFTYLMKENTPPNMHVHLRLNGPLLFSDFAKFDCDDQIVVKIVGIKFH